MNLRIGHGYDVHKFGDSGPITICGVEIEHEQGLLAHSDGDVALHALCDALLGALALGDIGKHFPCLLYTSPSPRDGLLSRMPSSA